MEHHVTLNSSQLSSEYLKSPPCPGAQANFPPQALCKVPLKRPGLRSDQLQEGNVLLPLQPLSGHKSISCLDVYCHVCPFTLVPPFPQAATGEKEKEIKKEKPVTLLKLHASPVAGIYSIEKVSPLQIESRLHGSSGQNKIESPPSKHVPGCLGISRKSPAHQSMGKK